MHFEYIICMHMHFNSTPNTMQHQIRNVQHNLVLIGGVGNMNFITELIIVLTFLLPQKWAEHL